METISCTWIVGLWGNDFHLPTDMQRLHPGNKIKRNFGRLRKIVPLEQVLSQEIMIRYIGQEVINSLYNSLYKSHKEKSCWKYLS